MGPDTISCRMYPARLLTVLFYAATDVDSIESSIGNSGLGVALKPSVFIQGSKHRLCLLSGLCRRS